MILSAKATRACRLTLAFSAAAIVVGCGSGSQASAHSSAASADSFSLATTKRCLRARHLAVAAVPRSDAQKAAFHDLAQRTSIEVSLRSTRVDLAFTPSADHANLLVELLSPSRPPYLVRTRANVVVMQRKNADAAAVAKILRCLR